ncbi:thiamine transporter, partial [Klebsiella pneumoniae]
MATRRQPLNLRGLMPGLFAATLLCAVALAAFLALWFSAPGAGWQSVFSDSYL